MLVARFQSSNRGKHGYYCRPTEVPVSLSDKFEPITKERVDKLY